MPSAEAYNQIIDHLNSLNVTLERVRQALAILTDVEMSQEVRDCQKDLIVAYIDGAEPKCEAIKDIVRDW